MDIIDAYYQTAADLKQEAERLMWAAEMLAQKADRMCEERMPEKSPSTSCAPQSSDNGRAEP